MFGIISYERLPDEYVTSYAYWDTYMATVWAALLSGYGFDPNMTVIEIAPGTSTKVGLALQKCKFQGKLYIVEPSEKSLSTVSSLYKSLLPNAEIYPIQRHLLDSLDSLPRNPDVVLSNHPLDDMLIANRWDKPNDACLFNWALSPSEEISSVFLQQWTGWMSDLNQLHSAKTHVIQQWNTLYYKVNPAVTILSQYPSITLQKNQLNDINLHASDILSHLKNSDPCIDVIAQCLQVQAILNQLENYNDVHIGTEVLNAKNWLVRLR